MAFKKMKKPTYPPRCWSLVGYPGSGKSSFAAQMRGPKVVIDADHRFTEVLEISTGEVYELSENGSDNVDPDIISRLLYKNMPNSGVQTIIVDSLTAIITPLTIQAMIDSDKGRERNLMSAFKTKALAMRQLQDAVSRWGTDVLWIYHLQDSRDARAKEVTRTTVSQTEIARLTRSINVQLEVVQENEKRGVKIIWARRGRSGLVLWDDSGCWKDMPEKIEEAIYGGLTKADQDRIAAATPKIFKTPEIAMSWGLEQGAFKKIEDARRAYESLKKNTQPGSAQEMANLWINEVRSRLSAAESDEVTPLRAIS